MRRHDCALLALAAAFVCAGAGADPAGYGQTDTFQPGKKYNCVPTADRKGWNCAESGKATIPPPESATTTSAPAAPPPVPAAATPTIAPEPLPRTQPPSSLPGYLTNAAANPMQPMLAAPAPKPAPRPRVKGPLVPAKAPAPPTASTPPPATKPAPVAAAVPPPAPIPHATTHVDAADDFLALPADAYVIELAHADSETDLAAPNPPRESVYKLHLRQNGADVWMLVCGPYDNLGVARAARDELAAQGATPGWPRRIGPLQTEVRRAQP